MEKNIVFTWAKSCYEQSFNTIKNATLFNTIDPITAHEFKLKDLIMEPETFFEFDEDTSFEWLALFHEMYSEFLRLVHDTMKENKNKKIYMFTYNDGNHNYMAWSLKSLGEYILERQNVKTSTEIAFLKQFFNSMGEAYSIHCDEIGGTCISVDPLGFIDRYIDSGCDRYSVTFWKEVPETSTSPSDTVEHSVASGLKSIDEAAKSFCLNIMSERVNCALTELGYAQLAKEQKEEVPF